MRINFLILMMLVISFCASAQNRMPLGPVYTVVSTAQLIAEERATLRIAITHVAGNTIAGYRAKDKAFYVRSINEASSKALREKVQKFYVKAVVSSSKFSDQRSAGFTDVVYKTILPDPAFPVYIETGDHELDETSYQYEKSDWQQTHPHK